MSGLPRRLELGALERRPLAKTRADDAGRGGSFSYGLVVLFLLVLYSNVAVLVPAAAIVGPAQSLGAAAVMALLVERGLGRRGFDVVWPDGFLLLGFLGASALSTVRAFWPSLAVECTLDLAKMCLVHLLLVNVIDSAGRVRGLLWTMVVGGLFPALGTLSHYASGVLVEGRAGWIGIFENPNELAYSLVVLVPLAAVLASTSPSSMLKLVAWGSLALYVGAIAVSYSRGGMLGLVVVLAVMGLRQRRGSLRVAILVLLAASVVYGAFFWSRSAGFSHLGSDTTFQQRLTTIQAGIAMFAERPLLGVGLGCSAVAWPLFVPTSLQLGGWLHTHNTFTQALSETGLLGTGPFFLLVGAALRQGGLVRDGHGHEDLPALAGALQASLAGFLVCGLSGGYLLSWFPYLLTGLLSGVGKIRAAEE